MATEATGCPTRWRTAAFALPGLALAWLVPPMYAILGDFYLRHTAATASGIATAMVLSKLVDAITDLPVGYWSDTTRTRWGARKPWIVAGVILSMPMFWWVFRPSATAGNADFLFGIILYYLVYTLVKIPYRSWLGEVAPGYEERSRLWGWFTMALLVGGVLVMLIPLVVSSPWVGWYDSAEFDRDMMRLVGGVGMVLLPLTVIIACIVVPQGQRNPGKPPAARLFFHVLAECAPLRHFLAGYLLSALGFGVFYAVVIVALTSYYGFAAQVPLFLLCMTGAQVATIPLWERLARRYAKHRVWAVAWAGHALFALVFWLFAENTPLFWLFVACASVTSILQGPHMLFPVSILSDIVDYDTVRNRVSRSGNLFSLFTFVDKAVHALGFGIGYYCLAAFGYDAKSSANDAWAVFGLKLAFILIPSVLFLLSALVLYRFPIDALRHARIRAIMLRRESRLVQRSIVPC